MTTAPQMPGFTKTVNAVVIRSSVWLGIRRICNDLRRPKNKCRNRPIPVDTNAYVMQSLRMTTNYKVTVSRAVTATEVREFTVLAEDRDRAREIAAMYAAEGCATCVAPATQVVNVMGMSNQEIKARL